MLGLSFTTQRKLAKLGDVPKQRIKLEGEAKAHLVEFPGPTSTFHVDLCLFHTNGSGTRLRPVPVVHSNDTTRSREDTTCYCSLCFEKNSRMFMLPVSIQTAL